MKTRLAFATLILLCFAITPAFGREILFGGDVTLTRNIQPSQNEFFTAKSRDLINNADLFIWNLEFSGASNNRKTKPFVFSCDSDIVKNMKFDNGVAIVANNHSFDGNVEGFKNLINSLDKYGMKYCGLRNQDPDKNYTEIDKGDHKYFVIGYSPMSHSADPVYNTTRWEDVLETVKYLNSIKSEGDVIIVNIHDGIEKTKNISQTQRTQANALANLDVNIVSFTHSHTYMEPEKIKDTIVLWGMGNFIFGGNQAWRNNSDVRMMSVDPDSRTWQWIKGHTKNYVFDVPDKDV